MGVSVVSVGVGWGGGVCGVGVVSLASPPLDLDFDLYLDEAWRVCVGEASGSSPIRFSVSESVARE